MRRIFLICLFMAMTLSYGCGKKTAENNAKEEETPGVVHLKEESQKMVNLEFVKVAKHPLEDSIQAVGEIAQETENVLHVTSLQPGTMKSYLVQIGDVVEKDGPVMEIQPKTGEAIKILSSIHGIVIAEYLKPGDAIDSLTSVMTIANPDVLRASLNVYEKDVAGLKLGQKVQIKSIGYPGKIFDGEIGFISPSVDEKTRAIKIRVNVKNEKHELKFGMFVTGKILIPISDPVLTVPEAALQDIKGRQVVFVVNQDKKEEFMIRDVKIGQRAEEQLEILEGVSEGDEVVANGSFYVKSELLKEELEEE